MHPGDNLHNAPVTVAQAPPIDVFHLADIGFAVSGDGNAGLAGQHAGHTGGPQDFVFTQAVIDEFLRVTEKLQGLSDIGQGRRDQFQQRLGIVRGDVGIGQCRSQGERMGRLRDATVAVDPQALFFHPGAAIFQQVLRRVVHQRTQTLFSDAI